MRVVVTGASGNIGSAVLRRLSADGHELIGLSRRPPAPGFGGPDTTWHTADLTTDACTSTLREAFSGADAVVHLAWGFQPSHDLRYLRELGIGGTRRVVEAVKATGIPHLVHMSSVGAYSPASDGRPVDESWPTEGVPSSPYSRHKAAAERILDDLERAGGPLVTRLRPGIVGQRSAGSALSRYGVPGYLPTPLLDLALRHLPVLPLDRTLAIPMVHSDDVADAVARVVEQQATGAFNLAAEPPLTTDRIAAVLGARPIHVPAPLLRAAVSASWHLHLQQVDPGWVDLAFAVPLLDTTRARDVLGWRPAYDAEAVLAETVEGVRTAAADRSPVLRPRSIKQVLSDAVRRGPVAERREP